MPTPKNDFKYWNHVPKIESNISKKDTKNRKPKKLYQK
jgi:hypothetical protein